jgi:alpha-galactosidase
VKHDFSTYDIFWKWGFDFGDAPAAMTKEEWHFADKSRTTAEIIKALYGAMREAAGEDMLLLGCNTIGHLGAGYFEIQRTGDDTSGIEWERTRKMGINTLAFRMAQHDALFAVDADCVGLTNDIPWELNGQWLDLLARSGTPLFVSADPQALGNEQKTALREAFELAARPQPVAEPLDWLQTTCPTKWRIGDEIQQYDWFDERLF